jgi:1-deoxy-D-xylulose-5-phosphate synthase
MSNYPLLERINSPRDLRALPEAELTRLAGELRAFLVETVSRSGGHFAASLGTVELTIALHYVFATPEDRLVWDVGHQCYGHKVLTGRRESLHTIRKPGGLAPFPRREESPYDTFGVGHSSTSISAALGMAYASTLQGHPRRCIAVIGDGAMTAGMAFEALNNAGDLGTDMLVVLNDNEMSISPNVGALSSHLTRLLSSKPFVSVRDGSKRVLEHVPPVYELARRAEEHVRGMVTHGSLFEELGIHYFGPTDGHDLPTLLRTLRNLTQINGPRLLHVVTRKGKGYRPAEEDPCGYHGVSVFDPKIGKAKAKPDPQPTYSKVFGDWLCDMAARDPRLVAVTPAMIEGSGMARFAREFPERCLDVGIAEQHAVTLTAGLACEGARPVMAIYSTFLQRAYDQLIHDVALQNLPVLFAIDRAGLVGADGPTHQGAFDLSYLRCIPNMVVMAPSDENECRRMLYTGMRLEGPSAVRYPRGQGPGVKLEPKMSEIPIGKSEHRRTGRQIAILAFGSMLHPALDAARELDASVINMRFVRPLDEEMVLSISHGHDLLVTVEENVTAGGAGSAVNECLASNGRTLPILNLGLPDLFVDHGNPNGLLAEYGLDGPGIVRAVKEFRGRTSRARGQLGETATAEIPRVGDNATLQ